LVPQKVSDDDATPPPPQQQQQVDEEERRRRTLIRVYRANKHEMKNQVPVVQPGDIFLSILVQVAEEDMG
jgi:hypothetical protein